MTFPDSDADASLLLRAAELLQDEDLTFPAAVQGVLLLLEDAWAPVRASVTLGNHVVLVTGRSEQSSGGAVTTVRLHRNNRIIGALSLERPAGRSDPFPEPAVRTLAVLLTQESEVRRLAGAGVSTGSELIGSSGVMQEVFRLVTLAAPSSAPVLLFGEAGVGKARLAELVHRRSSAAAGPFVVFSGSALPEAMVEGELFGHLRRSGGRFAEAAGGTLFLDEIGELSPAVQGRVVRLLNEPGPHPRIVASSRHPLEGRVAAGRFRPDLLARLEAHRILVPPLRDRGSDIIALADHFVARFSLRLGKTIKRISTPTLEMLLTYPWPGNVRELETVMERAVLLSDDEVLHGYHLPPSLQSSVHSGTRMHGRLADRLDSLEYEMLVEALKASRGNVTQAGRELGLTKRLMGLRMGKYELDYRTFRQGPSELADDDDWN